MLTVRTDPPGQRDTELVGMRPINLHACSWHPHLREKHFLRRPILRAPARDPALKGAQSVDRQERGPLREIMRQFAKLLNCDKRLPIRPAKPDPGRKFDLSSYADFPPATVYCPRQKSLWCRHG